MPRFIDPHIHMYTRTTDDYHRMYEAGIKAIVEPSFWLGEQRRYAGSFFDYFLHILDFEATRAERYGIDHYANVAMNPKEAEDLGLATEVLEGMGPYLDHPRCLAIGEIGYNRITPNEEIVFQRQLEMAKARGMLVMIHSPHDTPEVSKKEGIARSIDLVRALAYDADRILMDHNTEETMALTREAGLWAGLTVYPYSKLDPPRAVQIVKEWGIERTMINGSADWGVSDPCTVPKVAALMREEGFTEDEVDQLLFRNPLEWYAQSGRFEPRLALPFTHPSTYQR